MVDEAGGIDNLVESETISGRIGKRRMAFLDFMLDLHAKGQLPMEGEGRITLAGQRFALMEEKCILALLMRNLKVKSKLRTDQMRVSAELVIRPLFGNNIRFEPR
ncbi:unnamed protein product, partial [Litomosoides sigmodontis]